MNKYTISLTDEQCEKIAIEEIRDCLETAASCISENPDDIRDNEAVILASKVLLRYLGG